MQDSGSTGDSKKDAGTQPAQSRTAKEPQIHAFGLQKCRKYAENMKLTDDELELVEIFRSLSDEQRLAIKQVANTMKVND